MSDPILIWGAGAIGGSLGAALIRAGHEVVFVDNVPAHVQAIRDNGLRIDGPMFQDTVRAPAFLPEDVTGTYRRVFLCVKAQHTAGAAAALRPHLAEDGYVLSAQNGLNEIEIAAAVGPSRTMGCFVNFGADYLEPGVVHYSGKGAMVLGEIDGSDSARLAELGQTLRVFNPDLVLTTNIWGYLWGKLLYGSFLFATALTNESIADALDNPAWRPTFLAIGHEVARVAQAEGVTMEGFDGVMPAAFVPGAPAELVATSFAGMVAQNRQSTKSHSGVWRDLAVRKRKTEADAQIGPVVTIAARHGIAVPHVARLVALIHEIEDGKRPLAAENMDDLAAGALA